MFSVYFRLGFEHISDLAGYDHMLFIGALCAVYQLAQWRELLVLVTAFTVGHSVTLALATLGVIAVDSTLVEFLIPLTILLTAIVNLTDRSRSGDAPPQTFDRRRVLKYGLALTFGLIHGMGFSNFLRAVLGGEESIVLPLFAFNVGLEVGQILIAVAVLIGSFLVVRGLRVPHRRWMMVLSAAVAVVALFMMADRIPT